MSDGKHLVALPELPQLDPDRGGRLSPYARVHLIEDIGSARLDTLLREADREHDPAEFPTRGVAPYWELGFARVGLDHELHPLCARRSWRCGRKLGPEGGVCQVEVRQVLVHLLREPQRGLSPPRADRSRKLLEPPLSPLYPLFELGGLLTKVLETFQPPSGIFKVALDVGAVLALQPPQRGEALLHRLQPVRVGLQLVYVGPKPVEHVF